MAVADYSSDFEVHPVGTERELKILRARIVELEAQVALGNIPAELRRRLTEAHSRGDIGEVKRLRAEARRLAG